MFIVSCFVSSFQTEQCIHNLSKEPAYILNITDSQKLVSHKLKEYRSSDMSGIFLIM